MLIGELAGLVSALVWACNGALLRWLSPKADVLVLNALRCCIATLLLLVLVVVIGRADQLATLPLMPVLMLVASVLIGIGIGDSFYFHAIRLVGLARAQPLAMSYPLLTALLAVTVLGEQLTPLVAVGILLVVLGVTSVATAHAHPRPLEGPRPLGAAGAGHAADAAASHGLPRWMLPLVALGGQRVGVALGLGAAVSWAVGTTLLRPALESIDVWVASAVRMLAAAVVLQIFALRHLPAVRRVARADRRFAVGVLVLGIGTAISLTLFLLSVAYAGAARASALTSASPLFGVPLAVFVLHEQVNARLLVGVGLTLVGVWLIVLRSVISTG
jgi:drug/metabolite transporter (DMT)-like permease